MATDEIVEFFRKFKEGSDDAYWKMILHPRVQPLFQYQTKIIVVAFKFSEEEIEDYTHELYLKFRRRLNAFQTDLTKDSEHQANSLFKFFQLVLLGESDKVARYIKGTLSLDDRGYSSIKGFKYSLDHEIEQYELDPKQTFSHIFSQKLSINGSHDEKSQIIYAIRKLLFSYLCSRGEERFYKAFMEFYEIGNSWNQIAQKLNLKITEKQRYIKLASQLMVLLREFLYTETDMKLDVVILGIHTTHSNASMCVYAEGRERVVWTHDYFTHYELNTIEGKLGDIIRQYDVTWVILDEVDSDNQANTVIERILVRRGIIYEKRDITDLIIRIPNYEKLLRVKGWDDHEARAFIAARSKDVELEIAKHR